MLEEALQFIITVTIAKPAMSMQQYSQINPESVSTSGGLRHQALGAQLLGAELPGYGEIFYLSPLPAKAMVPSRGGVPVLFPQFAEAGPLRKHGYVRDMPWTLQEARKESDGESVIYTLNMDNQDIAQWPHSVSLQLKAERQGNQLTVSLNVLNSGTGAFSFTGGLHPYFLISDLRQARILGLQGLPVQDRYRQDLQSDAADVLSLGGNSFERLYDGCPAVQLRTPEKSLSLSATGFDQWMVWNPGEPGAKALADLPDADWQKFVCVEPVRVARPVHLEPGETFTGTLAINTD